MTAKEYLMQLPELRRRYHRRAIELELLRADLAPLRGISYDQAGGMLMPSSAARSEAMVNRIVDREAELAEEMRQLNDERTKIIRQIEALDDGRYGHLLFLMYVQEPNRSTTAMTGQGRLMAGHCWSLQKNMASTENVHRNTQTRKIKGDIL